MLKDAILSLKSCTFKSKTGKISTIEKTFLWLIKMLSLKVANILRTVTEYIETNIDLICFHPLFNVFLTTAVLYLSLYWWWYLLGVILIFLIIKERNYSVLWLCAECYIVFVLGHLTRKGEVHTFALCGLLHTVSRERNLHV